jgi:NADPH:quinone reductase-like Zn-dependent oxidoreductase
MRRFGGPEVLEVGDWPDPVAAAGQALVRVLAAGLNRMDVLTRRGPGGPFTHTPALPHIPGADLAGEVVAVGDPADAAWLGRRVAAYGAVTCGVCDACRDGFEVGCARYALIGEHLPGGLAELACVPVRNLLPLPDGADMAKAAVLNAAYTTAWNMLESAGPLPGRWVGVVGASGGVGVAAVQLARLAGARVLAITRSPDKAARLGEIGADRVVVGADGFAPAVRQVAPRGLDLVVNTVGGDTFSASVDALRPGGTLALCGAHGGDAVAASLRQIYQLRRRVVGAPFGTFAQFRQVVDLFAAGALVPVVDRVFPLVDIAAAHRHLEAAAMVGKVVVRPA